MGEMPFPKQVAYVKGRILDVRNALAKNWTSFKYGRPRPPQHEVNKRARQLHAELNMYLDALDLLRDDPRIHQLPYDDR